MCGGAEEAEGDRSLRNTEHTQEKQGTPSSELHSHVWFNRHFKQSLLPQGLSQLNFWCRHLVAFSQAPGTCNVSLYHDSLHTQALPYYTSLPRKGMFTQA